MLEKIIHRLASFPLAPKQPAKHHCGRAAAVLVPIMGQKNPAVVLTRRAAHLNNHAGEVAFPGGMWDPTDEDLLHTALRESEEEIALSPADVTPLAMLPVSSPKRRDVQVTPFVGLVAGEPGFEPELGEIESVFVVPLCYLLDSQNYDYFDLPFMGEKFAFPCVDYQGYRIWGFTLRVLTDLLNHTLDAGIELRYPDEQRMRELYTRSETVQ